MTSIKTPSEQHHKSGMNHELDERSHRVISSLYFTGIRRYDKEQQRDGDSNCQPSSALDTGGHRDNPQRLPFAYSAADLLFLRFFRRYHLIYVLLRHAQIGDLRL